MLCHNFLAVLHFHDKSINVFSIGREYGIAHCTYCIKDPVHSINGHEVTNIPTIRGCCWQLQLQAPLSQLCHAFCPTSSCKRSWIKAVFLLWSYWNTVYTSHHRWPINSTLSGYDIIIMLVENFLSWLTLNVQNVFQQ